MRKGDDMDMNWQTMLHEAANASFEKDIEVRSAADNDAYSCVDLPKAKIRELSEKILHLPHQGIVLLFSRYCFRLSPQETEKFFQMKNAKGRFRFYRELLSTSMGLSSEQVISDASLNRACKIAMKDYLRTELKEDAAVSSTGKSRTHIVFRRFGKAVAVAAITIALWEYRHIVNLNMVCFIFISEINTLILGQVFNKVISLCSKSGKWKSYCKKYLCI